MFQVYVLRKDTGVYEPAIPHLIPKRSIAERLAKAGNKLAKAKKQPLFFKVEEVSK